MSLPELKAVKDLFEGLLGRDVTVAAGAAVDPTSTPGPTTAVYVDDRTALSSVVLMDFALTAYAGAALGLIPAGGAEAAIEDGELSDAVQENAAELLNVLAAALGDASGTHERLYQTFTPGQAPPPDVATWSAVAGPRRDVALSIKGYGEGLLSIIVTQEHR